MQRNITHSYGIVNTIYDAMTESERKHVLRRSSVARPRFHILDVYTTKSVDEGAYNAFCGCVDAAAA